MKSEKLVLLSLLWALTFENLYSDGLLQVTETKEFLRLSRNITEVQIIDQIALTTVTHEFVNTIDADSIQVAYMFPLPDNAAVTGFAIWRDSTFVDFVLTASDTGSSNQTIPGDADPALREYLLPNPFTVPTFVTDDTFRVKLSYAELLPFDFGAIGYVFPLASQGFSAGDLDALAFFVTISTQRSIRQIETPGYSSGIQQDDAFSATLGFDRANFLPSLDFVIDFQLAQEEVGLFTLTHLDPADTTESAGFFLSLIEPGDVQPSQILNKHFTFVLDRSGSMSGNKIVQAKAAARYSIEHLNPKDFFNIVDFSSSVAQFKPEAVRADAANVAEAVNYIEVIEANGGTNINQALVTALGQTLPNEVNQVIFLTDGRPTAGVTNKDDILRNVRVANTNAASIFVFGVGNNLGKDLLQALADENQGVATFIAENEPIDDIIVNFFSRISNPVLVDLSLDFGGAQVFDVFPRELPDLAAGFQLVVAGRYASFGPTDITLRGSVASADTAFVYPDINFPDSDLDNVFIPKIWAGRKIDHLFARWLKEGEPDSLKQQIIAVSLKYGVLSPFTSFDQPDPSDDLTAVDGVMLSALKISVDFTRGRPLILLEWELRGELDEAVSIEVFRTRGPTGEFVRLASLSPGTRIYRDRTADPHRSYQYRLEVVLLSGFRVSANLYYEPRVADLFFLEQNHPNPFNPTTEIGFFLGRAGLVDITIFNLKGELVKTILKKNLNSGSHLVSWHGLDREGLRVASGVYFYKIRTPDFGFVRTMVLTR